MPIPKVKNIANSPRPRYFNSKGAKPQKKARIKPNKPKNKTKKILVRQKIYKPTKIPNKNEKKPTQKTCFGVSKPLTRILP